MNFLTKFKSYSDKHPLLFTILFLISFLLASSACTLRPEQQSYNFEVNSCSTGRHEFCTKEDMCRGLQSDDLNNYCAREIRKSHYYNNCSGRYFQEWGSVPASSVSECPGGSYGGSATFTYEQTASRTDSTSSQQKHPVPSLLVRECVVAIHDANLISATELEMLWKSQKILKHSELLRKEVRISEPQNSSSIKQQFVSHVFQTGAVSNSIYLTLSYNDVTILAYHYNPSAATGTEIDFNSKINLSGNTFSIKSSPYSHLILDCSLK